MRHHTMRPMGGQYVCELPLPDSAAAKGDKKALKGEVQPRDEQIAFASLMRGAHW